MTAVVLRFAGWAIPMPSNDDLDADRHVLRRPPDRLAHLNPHLREVFGSLGAQQADRLLALLNVEPGKLLALLEIDTETLKDMVKDHRSKKAVKGFLKWALVAAGGAFMLIATFGEHITSAWLNILRLFGHGGDR